MILNASYEPLTIVSIKRAIGLVLSGKAVIVEASSKIYQSKSFSIEVPYVIKLTYFVHRRTNIKPAKYSKATILARDGHKCAYCAKPATTVDHIIPKRHGGDNSYDNCVAACIRCNSKKADKLIKEVGYSLLIKPYTPSAYSTLLARAQSKPEVFEVWSKYIYLYQPQLEEVFNSRANLISVD